MSDQTNVKFSNQTTAPKIYYVKPQQVKAESFKDLSWLQSLCVITISGFCLLGMVYSWNYVKDYLKLGSDIDVHSLNL